MLRLDANINRSGKASKSTSQSGVIPANPLADYIGFAMFMDCYGVIYSTEDAIKHFRDQKADTPVMYALCVSKDSEDAEQVNYGLQYPLIVTAISEPVYNSEYDTDMVTIQWQFPLIRSLGGGAAMVSSGNVGCIDTSVLRQKTAVIIPDYAFKSTNGDPVQWVVDMPVGDVSVSQLGTITKRESGSNTTVYKASRLPLGSVEGNQMDANRLEPSRIYLSDHLPVNNGEWIYADDFFLPAALSKDGATLYFMCYRSELAMGDAPRIVTSYQFCTQSDKYHPVAQLQEAFLLFLGPESHPL